MASTPEDQPPPRLATLELDVAREDLLEEAARATAQHLPAGEHGNILFFFFSLLFSQTTEILLLNI